MGNELRRIVLAPSVSYADVVAFARALRAAHLPGTLTYSTLEDSRPRRPWVREAKQAGVLVIEVDVHADADRLLPLADETLGRDRYLYRDVDDEEVDECVPGPDWLRTTFGVSGLEWLLEPEEHPVPWRSANLYSIPQNPPELSVEFPFSLALLQVFLPGAPTGLHAGPGRLLSGLRHRLRPETRAGAVPEPGLPPCGRAV